MSSPENKAMECEHGQLARACEICDLCDSLDDAGKKIRALTARAEAAERQLRMARMCGTCGGTPHPSGLVCVCGGSGSAVEETHGLRVAAHNAERDLAEAVALLKSAVESNGEVSDRWRDQAEALCLRRRAPKEAGDG